MSSEYTLSIVKPDATKRNITGKINSLLEDNGLKIVAQKMVVLSQQEAQNFYQEHSSRPFFDDLVSFMISGPVIVQVLKGEGAVIKNRDVMGATDPQKAEPDSIRGMYGLDIEQNTVHGSDSITSAHREISFFFAECEIVE